MSKKLYLFLFCLLSAVVVFGQKKTISEKDKEKQERKERIAKLAKQSEENALIYNKQSAFGIKLNTDGWGLLYEHGKYKTVKITNLWWVELGERKHPKEDKQTLTTPSGGFILIGNPVIYGKANNFYQLKAGLGQQRLIGGKGNKNGVAVSAVYGGGLSAGILKPYYINVQLPNTGTIADIKYEGTPADSLFFDPTNIIGGAGFGKGFSELTFTPGAHAHAGLRFDYGRYNEVLSALEIGINAEFYAKKMPIMALSPEKQFFFNAYVAIEFGKRK